MEECSDFTVFFFLFGWPLGAASSCLIPLLLFN
jgi:hypothetical protein